MNRYEERCERIRLGLPLEPKKDGLISFFILIFFFFLQKKKKLIEEQIPALSPKQYRPFQITKIEKNSENSSIIVTCSYQINYNTLGISVGQHIFIKYL